MSSVDHKDNIEINTVTRLFDDYLQHHVMNPKLFGVINNISKKHSVYIFSGIIRDFFLNRSTLVRDLDFVIESDLKELIKYRKDIPTNINVKTNSFKGIKLLIEGEPNIDIWSFKDTWGLKEKKIKNPTLSDLIDSVFFNFSAIVYDIKKHKFIYSKPFIDFIKTRQLDIVYDKNPNIPLCLYNVFHYVTEYDLSLSNNLKNWVRSHYKENINFDSIQINHLGLIKYPSCRIHNFYKYFIL